MTASPPLSLPGDVNFLHRGDTYFIGRPGGDVVRYADSWRVPTNASLLCKGQKIESGKPGALIYANNLTQSQYQLD